MRTKNFKMLLTEVESQRFKDMAHEQRVSSADMVRSLVLGPDACQRLPSHTTLREILRQLQGIAGNLNQVTHLANSAKSTKVLNSSQFAAIYDAIEVGHQNWVKPKSLLMKQLGLVQSKPSTAKNLLS